MNYNWNGNANDVAAINKRIENDKQALVALLPELPAFDAEQ